MMKELEKYLKALREWFNLLLNRREVLNEQGKKSNEFKQLEEKLKIKEKELTELEKDLPIGKVFEKYKLNELERKIVRAYLIDEPNDYFNTSTAGDTLKLLLIDEDKILLARDLFYKESNLRKNNLITLTGYGKSILDSDFILSEKFIRELLGSKFDDEVEKFDEVEEIHYMYCGNCGTKLPESCFAICEKCGYFNRHPSAKCDECAKVGADVCRDAKKSVKGFTTAKAKEYKGKGWFVDDVGTT